MTRIRVLIADDHDLVRRGLRALVESQPGWEVCAEAANGREAVEQAEKLKPAIAVLDVSMPELNGLEAARRIRVACPGTEVLILTVHESEQLMRAVLEAGARGYILKSDAEDELVNALKSLSRHKPFFTGQVSEMVLEGYLNRHTSTPGELLSTREREVVQLLAEGKSSKDVAVSLCISVNTAETHRANIMRKLGLHSISDLVRYAIRNKLAQA